MLYIRIFLVLGMVLHKVVWEVMKRGDHVPNIEQKDSGLGIKSIFKLIKVGVLLFLIIQTLFLDLFPISANPASIRILGLVVYVLGLITAILGRVQLGKNWANLEDYQVIHGQKLVQAGIYSYIRHPIYIGDFLLILGLELTLNSWLVLIVVPLLAVIVKQTLAEEAILSRSFPDYSAYRQRTKMFIPFIV